MITQERLRQVLDYDPENGKFVWKIKLSRKTVIGAEAGTPSKGYIAIRIDGVSYLAHRLAWLFMTGIWPVYEIDHKNTYGRDNRWQNLRLASRRQQRANSNKGVRNTSGFKGVDWDKRKSKWRAKLCGKHIGYFDNAKAASEAYKIAANKLFGEFAR